jgi:hypothetical protein
VIFAVFAVTIGWIGLALDELLGQPSTNSLGQGLWFVGPALRGVVLTRLHPDRAGSLALTLRFPGVLAGSRSPRRSTPCWPG